MLAKFRHSLIHRRQYFSHRKTRFRLLILITLANGQILVTFFPLLIFDDFLDSGDAAGFLLVNVGQVVPATKLACEALLGRLVHMVHWGQWGPDG
jgi:hypothetical protein